MKHLILLFLCIVSLQLPRVFAQEPEEIEEVRKNAQAAKDHLIEDQKSLKEMIDQQQKVVDKAPEDTQERGKLIHYQTVYKRMQPQIDYLSEYLNKKNEDITQEDLAGAKLDVQNAQATIKLSEELKSEYLPSILRAYPKIK